MTTHYLKLWHPALGPVEMVVRVLGIKLRQVLTVEGNLDGFTPEQIVIGRLVIGRFGFTAEIVEKPKA
jgi:hypothetical protein